MDRNLRQCVPSAFAAILLKLTLTLNLEIVDVWSDLQTLARGLMPGRPAVYPFFTPAAAIHTLPSDGTLVTPMSFVKVQRLDGNTKMLRLLGSFDFPALTTLYVDLPGLDSPKILDAFEREPYLKIVI